jgi:hypothetical protein
MLTRVSRRRKLFNGGDLVVKVRFEVPRPASPPHRRQAEPAITALLIAICIAVGVNPEAAKFAIAILAFSICLWIAAQSAYRDASRRQRRRRPDNLSHH